MADAPAPTRRPLGPSLAVAAIVVVLGVLHAVWLHRERRGGPLDVDEAAYLTLAFWTSSADHRVFTGPFLLWRDSGYLAPLVPLVTAPFHYLFGRSIEVSRVTNLVFFALVVVATHLLARRLTTPWWSVVAALTVATIPTLTDYTRHYHFALAATAAFTLAVLALVRADRFADRRWSLCFGVALGLTLLARTYLLAFTPGLLVAALLLVWRTPPPTRRTAVVHLGLALGVAGLLAGSWYVFSAVEVWDYLTGFGYGEASTGYGPASVTSLRFWLADVVATVSDGFYVPLALALLVCAALGLAATWRAVPHPRRVRLLDAAALPVVIAVLGGFAALLTSRNDGTGFVLPLLPATVVLVVALTARIRPPALATAAAVLLVAVSVSNVVMKADVVAASDDEVALVPAPWAHLRVLDGRSVIDRYVDTFTDDPAQAEGWLQAGDELHRLIEANATPDDPDPEVLFVVEGPFLNSSTVALAAQTRGEPPFGARSLDVTSIDELRTPEALTAHLRALREEGVDQLVTGPEALAWEGQRLPEVLTAEAATDAGFAPVAVVALPDGREATLWVAAPPAP